MKSNPDRKKKIKELCDQALDLDSSERKAFLDQACAEDAALRREVESLLNKQSGEFLERPVVENVVDPIFWTEKQPFLRWWAALKIEESQCPKPARVTHPA